MRIILLTFYLLFSSGCLAQGPDYQILKGLYGRDRPQWDAAMRTTSKGVYVMMPLSVVLPVTSGILKDDKLMFRNSVKSAITIGLASSISTVLKYSIKRKRPYDRYGSVFIARDEPSTFSFPSGHTTTAFASATALTLSYRKWQVGVPAYALAGLVAYSRMRLGVHYPSDVLGGMVIGIGAGLLTWKLDALFNNQK